MSPNTLPAEFARFALRDAAVLIAAILLWLLAPVAEHWAIATGGVTGVCALLFHEWGHLYGAYRSGAVVHPAPMWSPFLFDLDSKLNSRAQFLSVSLWGFAATGIFLLVFALWLPLDTLAGRVAMGIGLLLATLTVVIEFPLAYRVYRGGTLPPVEIHRR